MARHSSALHLSGGGAGLLGGLVGALLADVGQQLGVALWHGGLHRIEPAPPRQLLDNQAHLWTIKSTYQNGLATHQARNAH